MTGEDGSPPAAAGRGFEENYAAAEQRLLEVIARTPPGAEETAPLKLPERLRARLSAIAGRVLAVRAVVTARAVLEASGTVGTDLLAAGLAFHALFSILPTLLLLTGLAGWLIQDVDARRTLLIELIARFPPLAGPVITDTIGRVAQEPVAFSLLGLFGLVWGASNFYDSLDDAMTRIFPSGRVRSFLERRVRGLLAVAVLVVAALAAIFLGSIWSFVEGALSATDQVALWRFVGPASTTLVMTAATLLVYLVVPVAAPSLRAAILPGLVAGIGMAALTNVYTLLAPRVIGALAAFGVLAALFGALIWLRFVFQFLLLGAMWARVRSRGLGPADPVVPDPPA